ncbi:TRAP transporter small permease [Vibrio gangliei]|uniref:TRAP transporter small permease n=1 Tax=Vibrio gangliei TaxID=2077090 RepID=UPI000D01AC46|nr:TRAP transporter small permease [Vibrio gangliei]
MPNSDRLDYHSELPGVLGTIDNFFSKVEAIMLATGVLLMALNTCINVVARFVFGEGLFFAGEINRILIILITFAGIGFAARLGRHIRMSAFFDMLPAKGRKWVMIVVSIITALIMLALAYFSFQYITSVYERGRILPALGFEIWWIYIWVPLGFAITALQYFLTAYKNLISDDVYLSSGVVDGYTDHEHDI